MLKSAEILWYKFNIVRYSKAIAMCDGRVLFITNEGGGRQSDQEFQDCLIQRKRYVQQRNFHRGELEKLNSKSSIRVE